MLLTLIGYSDWVKIRPSRQSLAIILTLSITKNHHSILYNEQKLGKLLLRKGLITILSRPSRFLSQTQKLEQPSKVSKFLLFQSLA